MKTRVWILLTVAIGLCAAACSPVVQNLQGTQWRLVSLNGKPLPEKIEITLEFMDGRAGGKSACNGYGAEYTQRGSRITLGPVVSTMMYCEEVMDYETEYLKAFGEAATYKTENAQLSLLNSAGMRVLVFEKAETTSKD